MHEYSCDVVRLYLFEPGKDLRPAKGTRQFSREFVAHQRKFQATMIKVVKANCSQEILVIILVPAILAIYVFLSIFFTLLGRW